jgi:hypothetical protein
MKLYREGGLQSHILGPNKHVPFVNNFTSTTGFNSCPALLLIILITLLDKMPKSNNPMHLWCGLGIGWPQ